MRKPILHRTIFKLTFWCLLCPVAFKYWTSENSLRSWRIFHSFSKQTPSYCFCEITSHLYMTLHEKSYIIIAYYLLLMLFNIFYSFRIFDQKKCPYEWRFSVMAKTCIFFSTAVVAGLFFSLFTWKRHHYLMRGHRQEFHIPTANWNLPRLACFFTMFSLPEFSWFFFQFFINLWWEQMQKKQHKEDASALLKFGLIIMSFPFFSLTLLLLLPKSTSFRFWISLSLWKYFRSLSNSS